MEFGKVFKHLSPTRSQNATSGARISGSNHVINNSKKKINFSDQTTSYSIKTLTTNFWPEKNNRNPPLPKMINSTIEIQEIIMHGPKS